MCNGDTQLIHLPPLTSKNSTKTKLIFRDEDQKWCYLTVQEPMTSDIPEFFFFPQITKVILPLYAYLLVLNLILDYHYIPIYLATIL